MRSHGHRDRGRGHFGDQRPLDPRTARMPQQGGERPGICLPRLAPTQRPRRGWPAPGTPRGARRGTGRAGKEPPAPGGLASAPGICGAPTVQRALLPPRDGAERMRCLRVNRACFPFTPSGSALLKNFLLLALGEYAFLACTARAGDSWAGKCPRSLIRASPDRARDPPPPFPAVGTPGDPGTCSRACTHTHAHTPMGGSIVALAPGSTIIAPTAGAVTLASLACTLPP